jgi:myo-inositol 2-dehydrogenase / D-chiro-inositol 1-dehydrogenase
VIRPALPLRVGVLSFAHYHANFWSESLAEKDVLTGVWDDDVSRRDDAAARFHTHAFDTVDALLESCNAVAICSETARHGELIEQAARRGVAVLCEKPLGVDLADCLRIARNVKERDIFFMQSFPKRFDPVSQKMREVVASDSLGRMTLVRVRHGHYYGLRPEFRASWHARRAQAGGGALLDEGVHAADLVAWLFGIPSHVVAHASRAALGLDVEDLGVAVFSWPSGLVAEITSSFTFAAGDTSVELYGTGGSLLVSGIDLASRDITQAGFVRTYRTGSEPPRWETSDLVPRFKVGEFHHQNALAFVDALARGLPPPITIDDGVTAGRMIDAAYRAAESGTSVTV